MLLLYTEKFFFGVFIILTIMGLPAKTVTGSVDYDAKLFLQNNYWAAWKLTFSQPLIYPSSSKVYWQVLLVPVLMYSLIQSVEWEI